MRIANLSISLIQVKKNTSANLQAEMAIRVERTNHPQGLECTAIDLAGNLYVRNHRYCQAGVYPYVDEGLD